jgi:hypothetical protein
MPLRAKKLMSRRKRPPSMTEKPTDEAARMAGAYFDALRDGDIPAFRAMFATRIRVTFDPRPLFARSGD